MGGLYFDKEKSVTCHHVSGWNFLEDDLVCELKERGAQLHPNVW